MTEKLLTSIYYDTKNSASFSGVENLYNAAILKQPSISRDDVKEWLSGELTYTLHKPLRKNFKRNRILVSHINEQWEADLVDMKEFSTKNKNITYILTVIDCFSKYAFVRPIKTKTGENVRIAFEDILKERRPLNLRTDKGKEFINETFQTFLKNNKINYFTSNDQKIKCAIVERFNRTLKGRMFKYFTSKGTRRYIDVLQDFVKAYNNSKHRSIKMRPVDVTATNESEVFKNNYKLNDMREVLLSKTIKKSNIKTGDKVRKGYNLKPFDRGFYPNYTDEIFTVEKTIKGDKQIVFKLKDYSGNSIEQRFYPEELQKITENLHRIEKILKTRTRNRQKEHFVKWLNYPDSYNSWVLAKDFQNVSQ